MKTRHCQTVSRIAVWIIVVLLFALSVQGVLLQLSYHTPIPTPRSCTPYPTSVCTPNPNDPRIAFSSDRACSRIRSYDIYVMNADGTCPTRLTDTWRDTRRPRWSPDGTRILFESGTRIGSSNILYVMNADGSEIRRIANCGQCDARAMWSPDGDWIAFMAGDDHRQCSLYTVDVDSADKRRLIDIPLEGLYWTCVGSGLGWSPDGRQIAFSGTDPQAGQREVYKINVDGSGLTNLTNHDAEDDFVAWMPDGYRMLFVSDRDVEILDPSRCRRILYIMDADGANVRRLLDGVSYHPAHGTWIPGSDTQIVADMDDGWYVVDIECVLAHPIALGDWLQECRARLPDPGTFRSTFYANWPPGGKQFVYEATDTGIGETDIFVVNFDGTGLTNLTNCPADDEDPAWSP